MDVAEAIELIRINQNSRNKVQTWCDLGCGTGTFTLALASMLPSGSTIYAIDKNEESLAQIPDRYREVTIRKEAVDLDKSNISLPPLDGVLVANLLHYIEHQGAFVERCRALSRRLLVVEYDYRSPSKWIPYPLGFSALKSLLLERGFKAISRIGTRPSIYEGELYSVYAE
jgi:SAM-dependent methyltransferase